MRYTLMVIIFTLLPCELVRQYIMNPGPVSRPTPVVVATVEPVRVTPTRVASTPTPTPTRTYTTSRIRSAREYNNSSSKVYNSAETKFMVDHMVGQGASRSDAQVFMNVLNQAQADWEAGR